MATDFVAASASSPQLMITISVLLATIVGVVVVGYTSGAIQEPPRTSLDVEASTDTDEIVIRISAATFSTSETPGSS